MRLNSGERRSLGRLNVYRHALASWYGPGLFGNRTGCGGTLRRRLGRRRQQVAAVRHQGDAAPPRARGPGPGDRPRSLRRAAASTT